MKKKVLFCALCVLCAVACAFAFAACDKNVETKSITFNEKNLTLSVGDTYTLSVSISPSNASYKKITWESKNPSVATVDDNGKVTAVSSGYAAVYAYAREDKTLFDVCNVNVLPQVDGVTLDMQSVDLELEGEKNSVIITATVSPSAEGRQVKWTASNPSVATVEAEQYGTEARIQAIGAGETTVTATVGNKSASCDVRVRGSQPINPNVTAVTLDKTELVTEVGFEDNVFVVVEAEQEVGVTVTSSNPQVVSAQSSGRYDEKIMFQVNASAVGEGTLTFTAADKSAVLKVTVRPAPTKVEGSAGLSYVQVTGNTYLVNGIGTCNDQNIVIGNYHEGKRVTGVHINSFSRNTDIGSVTLTEGIYTIREGAFQDCTALTSVSLPQSLTVIDDAAFRNTSVEELTVPNGVVTIGEEAFRSCRQLQSVSLGSGVKVLGEDAFYYCNQLQDVTVESNNAYFTCEGGILYNKDKTHLIFATNSLTGEIEISDGVEEIYRHAFSLCRGITSVKIGNDVDKICDGAFENCRDITVYVGSIEQWCKIEGLPNLASRVADGELLVNGQQLSGKITIPDSVTEISGYMFGACGRITGVTIPAGVKKIGYLGFSYNCILAEINYLGMLNDWCKIEGLNVLMNCSANEGKLTIDGEEITGELVIPDTVTSIADSAFCNCRNITSVTVPDSVTEIGEEAFGGCAKLESVSLGAGITSDLEKMFGGCYKLASVTFDENNSAYASFGGVVYNKTKTEIVFVPKGISGEVTVADGVTEIGEETFARCEYLTGVIIPNSVISIDDYAFSRPSGGLEITLGSGVQSIGEGAFNGSYVGKVDFVGTIEDWCAIEGLGNLTRQLALVDDVVLTVGGEGISGNLVIPQEVTAICDYAFYGCNITSVTIPDGIESVGANAFNYCFNLTEIIYPEGFDVNGLRLEGCNKFKGTLVGSVYVFGTKLMDIAENSTFAVIPSTVSVIPSNVLSQASTLRYLFIPDTVTTVEPNAFANCSELTVIGKNISGISSQIKESVVLPDSKCTDDGWICEVVQYTYYDVISIQGYIGTGGTVTIPSKIDDLPVRWVPLNPVFLKRDDITKIIITSAEFQVDGNGLFELPNLAEIELADTVRELTIYAPIFADCQSLARISLAGVYQNYVITKKATPTSEVAETVTPNDAADVLAHIKNSTYKVFTIKKAS